MSLDDITADALHDVFLSPAPAEKRVNKFQPKPSIKPKKTAASASNPSNESEESSASKTEDDPLATTGVVEAAGASNLGSSSEAPMDVLSQVVDAQEPVGANEELTHEVACDPDKQEEEAMPLLAGMEPPDDIFLQPSETAVKTVGKFQPKSRSLSKNHEIISQPKKKKAKSVSFSLPDTAEAAAAPVEAQSDTQPSFLQTMNDADKIPHSMAGISDDVDFQLDHENTRREESVDLPDSILSESTSVTGKTAPEFRHKPGAKIKIVKSSTSGNTNGAKDSTSSPWDALPLDIESLEDLNLCTENLANEQSESIEMPSVDSGSPGGNEVFETFDTTLDSNNYIRGKTKLSAVSEDTGNEGQTWDDDGQTQERLDDHSKSKASEERDVGISLRKLRKRTAACKLDVGISENLDVENNDNSRIVEGHSDDEHRGEDMPKQKKQRKRSKRQMTDAEKPTKRCRKTSKEIDSTKPEPPKKRFPHGTRRKRRQVDKVLLETPEEELDRRHIAIKQLILFGEAKEKISSKEAASLNNNQSNTGLFPGGAYYDPDNPFGDDLDPFGDKEHLNMLRNSKKINYMTHMAKPQRGKWSKAETELFYEAIQQFGTDFGMIVQLFPNRTREQVKSKFKLEERKHPLEIHDAMSHRSGDHSHYKKVMELLHAQAEEESRQDDENGDPTTVSQDADNGYEEQRDRPEKEEEAADGFDSVEIDPEKLNEWEADGITDYNEYESVEWDDNGSFPQDDEKYSEFEEIF